MTSTTAPAAFTRKRAFRLGAGAASAGVLGAFSLIGATPAMAATDADCDVTLIGGTDAPSEIQTALDSNANDVVCLGGTFELDTTLIYYSDVTLHGIAGGATLDGGGDTQILTYGTVEEAPTPYLTVENLRFTGGSSSEGGAIEAYGLTVINSTFDDNEGFIGGAIWAYSAEITDSTFTDNDAAFTGGAVTVQNGVVVYGSTFSQNVSDDIGGAIRSYGFVDVTNSTFVENTGGIGAAISTEDGQIVQSTFLDNNGTSPQEGQAVIQTGGESLDLRGNIFATNSGLYSQVANYSETGDIIDLGGNVFSTAVALENDFSPAASTKFGKSPVALFGANTLAANGGLTQTVALIPTSPAIDAVPVGEPSVAFDQRGVARDARSDAGAYEYVGPVLAATGSTPDGWVAGIAGGLLAAGAAALLMTRRRFSRR